MPPKKTASKRKLISNDKKTTTKRVRTNRKSAKKVGRKSQHSILVIRQKAEPDYKRPHLDITLKMFSDRESALKYCKNDFINVSSCVLSDVDNLPKTPHDFLELFEQHVFADGYMENSPLNYTLVAMNQSKRKTDEKGEIIKFKNEEVDLKQFVIPALAVLEGSHSGDKNSSHKQKSNFQTVVGNEEEEQEVEKSQ